MRRILALLALLLLLHGGEVAAYWHFQSGKLFYRINSNNTSVTVTIASPEYPYAGDIEIPSTVEWDGTTYNVTAIEDYAFSDTTTSFAGSNVTSVTIPNSVTSIGKGVFEFCDKLESVTLPASLTAIPERMFYNCHSLKSIDIPSGVKTIGYDAFTECWALTEVELPEGLTTIASSAFWGCSLTSVTIPSSVTTMGGWAFAYCPVLKEVYFNATNCSGAGFFYVKTSNNGYKEGVWCSWLVGCDSLATVVVGDNVTTLPDNFLNGQYNAVKVKKVIFGSGLTAIPDYCCANCPLLDSVYIPEGVTSIGMRAFEGAGIVSLHLPASVSSCGRGAFNAPQLESITVDAASLHFCSVSGVLYDKAKTAIYFVPHSIEEMDIPEGVTKVPDEAITFRPKLAVLTIPRSMKYIGYDAFNGCTALKTIYYNADSCALYNWIGYTDQTNVLESVVIGEHVKVVPDYFLLPKKSGFPLLTGITLPDSVKSIGNSAFAGCSSLSDINIPATVTYIGPSAFYGCSSLTSVVVPASVDSIGKSAFSNCSGLVSVELHEGLKAIGERVFIGCSSLASVAIPDSLKEIGEAVFYGCLSLKDVTLPDGLVTIGREAFRNCSKLETINIPVSVMEIGLDAFKGCTSLPEEQNIRYADTYLAEVVDKAQSQYIVRGGTRWIGDYSFDGCSGATQVLVPNGVERIGDYAFRDCTSLEEFDFPSSVEVIGGGVFSGCSKLTSVTVPKRVEAAAFSGCLSLESVTVPPATVYIGSDAFKGCKELASVYYNADSCVVAKGWLTGCDNLSTVTIGSNVKHLSAYFMQDCMNVTSIELPAELLSIGEYAFKNCKGLTSVVVPDGVTNLNSYTFSNCAALEELLLPDGLETIGNYVFSGCKGLKQLVFGSALKNMGYDIFSGCTLLDTLWLNSVKPPSISSNFSPFSSGQKDTLTIVVPCGKVDTYKADSKWSAMADITSVNCPTATAEAALYICQGDSVLVGGQYVKQPGLYIDTIHLTDYDSIVHLSVFVNPSYHFTFEAEVMAGSSYKMNGFSRKKAGTYNRYLKSVDGCDSTVTLVLNVVEGGSPVYDSVTMYDTIAVYDTIIQYVYDTIAVVDTQYVVDTLVVVDTHYVTEIVYDTIAVADTHYVTEIVYDTIAVADTQYVTEIVYDTIAVADTHYVTEIVYDTIAVADTHYVTEIVYDTIAVVDTQYVTELVYDTIAVVDTQYVTVPVYDTIMMVDTIYITDTIVPCANAYTYIYATIHDGETYSYHGFNVSEAGTYVQHLTTDEGCDSTVTLYLQTAVGIDEVDGTHVINIYPNPAARVGSPTVTIEGAEGEVKVVDAQGRVVRRLNGNGEVQTLDIQGLSSGVYYILSGRVAKKLVVE